MAWKDSDSFRRLKNFSRSLPPQSSALTALAVSKPPSSVLPATAASSAREEVVEKAPSPFLAGPDGIKQAWQVLHDVDRCKLFHEPVQIKSHTWNLWSLLINDGFYDVLG